MTLQAQSIMDELNRAPTGPVTLIILCLLIGWMAARFWPRKVAEMPDVATLVDALEDKLTPRLDDLRERVGKIHVTLYGNGGKGELSRIDEEMKRLRDGRHDFVAEINEKWAKAQIEIQRDITAIILRLDNLERRKRNE